MSRSSIFQFSISNVNFQNLNNEGKTDMFSELMISILSTMSDFERKMIKERQMEGIRIRKEKGLYTGRKVGTVVSPEKFLQREKSQMILKDLENGYSSKEIIFRCRCSYSTISKVKNLNEQLNNKNEQQSTI